MQEEQSWLHFGVLEHLEIISLLLHETQLSIAFVFFAYFIMITLFLSISPMICLNNIIVWTTKMKFLIYWKLI